MEHAAGVGNAEGAITIARAPGLGCYDSFIVVAG